MHYIHHSEEFAYLPGRQFLSISCHQRCVPLTSITGRAKMLARNRDEYSSDYSTIEFLICESPTWGKERVGSLHHASACLVLKDGVAVYAVYPSLAQAASGGYGQS